MLRSFGFSVAVLVILFAGARSPEKVEGQEPRACDLVGLTDAAAVIGGDAMSPGDTEQTSCMYLNPGVAILTIRMDRAEFYDQLPISTPHAPESVGERGRSHRRDSGGAVLQFVKGGWSVTLDANPMGGANDVDYHPALVNVAQLAETRLP